MSRVDWTVESFLAQASQFALGHLPTESSHPDTRDLSIWAENDVAQGIRNLIKVDRSALKQTLERQEIAQELRRSVEQTFAQGGRVFLCGCGATGRLSLSIETLWRKSKKGLDKDKVIGFMAGGDVALVHSIEGFEDYPEWGARQLRDHGFAENDLLIATTEGGETPWVIGATLEAAKISHQKPYFLYCNPDDVLVAKIDRSRQVIQNPKVNARCLSVGPMALAGSTRMQASTVLMLVAGWATLGESKDFAAEVEGLSKALGVISIESLSELVKKEAAIYQDGHFVIYKVSDFAITVFTDTTERSPTFSLPAFDHRTRQSPQSSLVYVEITQAKNTEESWHLLLDRAPKPLDWPGVDPKATMESLRGFDFSKSVSDWRKSLIPNREHHDFYIHAQSGNILLEFLNQKMQIDAKGLGSLSQNLLLKMVLNIHSTLLMGRLGRYYTNLMTYVRPNNAKLIDRAARYVAQLLGDPSHKKVSYESIVREIFRQKEMIKENEAIVLKVLKALEK